MRIYWFQAEALASPMEASLLGPQVDPIVEVVLGHGVMVGKTDFLQTNLERLGRQFSRFPHRVMAERCVHVVVRR